MQRQGGVGGASCSQMLNQGYHCGHFEDMGRELMVCVVEECTMWTILFCFAGNLILVPVSLSKVFSIFFLDLFTVERQNFFQIIGQKKKVKNTHTEFLCPCLFT